MEFLGTFGCIWSLKEAKYVIIGRAEQGSEVLQRRHESNMPRATPRGRSRLYGETTRSEARSDLSERPTEVAPGGRSNMPRSLRV
ncbi:hypothetical protein DY000_02004220 [Brassica cretica]|uniref:Uncharacterized protein n=1 Tax=Brassica cretica TaxID=69181 RepID=A0ABQ7CE72_BRACR|nr:hypothetical protein DY000_02004220 [Brassica cretica]